MRYFLLLCLIAFVGGCGYYYLKTTEEYNAAVKKDQEAYYRVANELVTRKMDLGELILQNEKELEKLKQVPSETVKARANEEEEENSPLSDGANELKTVARSKADLVARKKALTKLLNDEKQKQENFARRVDKLVETNYKTMEARRSKAYQDFEKRMDADKTRLSEGKGPRYAREKKKLDEKAVAYQNSVNQQNDQLRARQQKSLDRLTALEKKINDQINIIEEMLSDSVISEQKQQQLADGMIQIVGQTNEKETAVQENQAEAVETESKEFELTYLNRELVNTEQLIKLAETEHRETVKVSEKAYNDQIENLKIIGGIGGAFLGLLVLASFMFARAQY